MSQERPPWLLKLMEDLDRAGSQNLDGQISASPTLQGSGSYGRVYKGAYGDVRGHSEPPYWKETN